ncbi:MAG TPA: SAM-dependent methyltransferase [Methylovirgula sp.]|nr:SAM-dependent methyltransferase [Methylovirgula sp.]
MNDALIQDVSDTAFMVATYRAMETERPDALFRDPLAEKLAGARGRAIVADAPRRASFGRWFLSIRTCIIDRFIESALAEGFDTVLNLGAGLDTRPYRMDLPKSLHWIEVDYPKIIDFKDQCLAGETARCRLERVKLDLADDGARREFLSGIAQDAAKVLIITEGVVPYLTLEQAASLADDLHAHGAFRYWIIDYLSPEARRYRQRMAKKLRMENAPFRFDPADYFQFFKERGWQSKEICYIAEEAKKLNRRPEMPFFFSLWVKVSGLFAAKRKSFAKSAAYVLLEPTTAD